MLAVLQRVCCVSAGSYGWNAWGPHHGAGKHYQIASSEFTGCAPTIQRYHGPMSGLVAICLHACVCVLWEHKGMLAWSTITPHAQKICHSASKPSHIFKENLLNQRRCNFRTKFIPVHKWMANENRHDIVLVKNVEPQVVQTHIFIKLFVWLNRVIQ